MPAWSLARLRACSSLGFDLVTRAIDPEDAASARACSPSILERERPAGIVLSPPLSDDLDLLGCAAMRRSGSSRSRPASGRAIGRAGSRHRRARRRPSDRAASRCRLAIAAWASSKDRRTIGRRRFATMASSMRFAKRNRRRSHGPLTGDFTFQVGGRGGRQPASRAAIR